MCEEGVDLGLAQLGGVALAMEEDELLDPEDVGILGSNRVVVCAEGVADLVEESRHRGQMPLGGRNPIYSLVSRCGIWDNPIRFGNRRQE